MWALGRPTCNIL